MTDNQYVFLGGLHKSGTSILHRCLRDHPEISGFSDTGVHQDEGQLLQSVYPAASAHGGWGRFGFDPAAHLTEQSVAPGMRAGLDAAWDEYWDRSRPILVEKSPPNMIHMRFLAELFPNSRFVMILRHPIAVTLASLKWAKNHPLRRIAKRRTAGRLIEHWLACHRIMRADAAHIDNLMVFMYEDFVVEPDRVLGEIYEFIGASPHQRRLEIHGGNEEDRYLTQWRQMRSRLWYRPYAEMVERRHEAAVGEFGYSLTDPTRRHEWTLR